MTVKNADVHITPAAQTMITEKGFTKFIMTFNTDIPIQVNINQAAAIIENFCKDIGGETKEIIQDLQEKCYRFTMNYEENTFSLDWQKEYLIPSAYRMYESNE